MSRTLFVARLTLAGLLSLLGIIIVGRGLLEAAPFTFTLMGALMIGLGISRLRTLRSELSGRR